MKTCFSILSIITIFCFHANSQNYECKMIRYLDNQAQICFPINHTCIDPHGIGSRTTIETDCWTGGSRLCNPARKRYPQCAGGIIATTCKQVKTSTDTINACFPIGHVCMDPHGIGNGIPTKTDCWEGGSRLCNKSAENWPQCAGGLRTKN